MRVGLSAGLMVLIAGCASQSKVDRLEQQVATLQSKMQSEQAQALAANRAEIAAFKQQVDRVYEGQVKELASMVETQKDALDRMAAQLDAVKKLEVWFAEHDELIRSAVTEYGNVRGEMVALVAEMETTEAALNKDIATNATAIERNRQSLSRDISEVKNNLAGAERRLGDLLQTLGGDLQVLRNQTADNQDALQSALNQLSAAIERVTHLQRDQVREQLKAYESSLTQIDSLLPEHTLRGPRLGDRLDQPTDLKALEKQVQTTP